jgi:hypothetical protein
MGFSKVRGSAGHCGSATKPGRLSQAWREKWRCGWFAV